MKICRHISAVSAGTTATNCQVYRIIGRIPLSRPNPREEDHGLTLRSGAGPPRTLDTAMTEELAFKVVGPLYRLSPP